MKHKAFVLLPMAALLVAGVTPVLAKSISQKQFKQHIAMRGQFDVKHNEELAKILGITVDDLTARLAAGKTPPEIATELGISEVDFKNKMQSAALANIKTHLAEEVANGKLTQDEADAKIIQLEKDIQDGKFPMGPYGRGGLGKGFPGGMEFGIKHNEVIAKILGITADDLKARLEAGKKISDILKELGMSETDFQAKMQTAHIAEMKAHLAEQVAAGKLTQAEANARIAAMADVVENGGFRKGAGPGMGMMGGRGHRGGAPGLTAPNTTPTK
jgi:predicted transcriptional regulator